MSNRIKIPEKLKQSLLYQSAFVCVVCQELKVQVHHIDQNRNNNVEDNLVVLCHLHHDEAHSTSTLSQNLTSTRLKKFKKEWLAQVAEKRELATSVEGQQGRVDSWSKIGISWGYINFSRVSQLITPGIIANVDHALLRRCQLRAIVDESGIVIPPASRAQADNHFRNTIYDWFPMGDDHALHKLYTEFVDQIAKNIRPVHLDVNSWTKEFVDNYLQEGQFIFFIRGQHFKVISEDVENAHVRVKTTKKKICIEYFIDTKFMFGTTSISVSFAGHSVCSSLVQIKSIDKSRETWILHCSPIGLGIGFSTPAIKSPGAETLQNVEF
jgi:hypothetical protein